MSLGSVQHPKPPCPTAWCSRQGQGSTEPAGSSTAPRLTSGCSCCSSPATGSSVLGHRATHFLHPTPVGSHGSAISSTVGTLGCHTAHSACPACKDLCRQLGGSRQSPSTGLVVGGSPPGCSPGANSTGEGVHLTGLPAAPALQQGHGDGQQRAVAHPLPLLCLPLCCISWHLAVIHSPALYFGHRTVPQASH